VGAEPVDVLAPQEGDVIVEEKRGVGASATTNLDFILAPGGFLRNRDVPRGDGGEAVHGGAAGPGRWVLMSRSASPERLWR
jgi:hypothetical protein